MSPTRANSVLRIGALAVALVASACSGESISIGDSTANSMDPAKPGTPGVSYSALAASVNSDGSYVSDDGAITGSYDVATNAFTLRWAEVDEVSETVVANLEQEGVYLLDGDVELGARYTHRVIDLDGAVSEVDVELDNFADRKELRWDEAPELTLMRSNTASIFPDMDGEYRANSRWSLDLVDEDPSTAISPDAVGFYEVGFSTPGEWDGGYFRTYDDGSTYDAVTCGAIGGAAKIEYEWDDASTPQPLDEIAILIVTADRTWGPVTRYDEAGEATCVWISIADGAYSEQSCEGLDAPDTCD